MDGSFIDGGGDYEGTLTDLRSRRSEPLAHLRF